MIVSVYSAFATIVEVEVAAARLCFEFWQEKMQDFLGLDEGVGGAPLS